ncbi:DUF2946 domain-containing protein [Marinomonas sp. TW1]|uniref:DUF2946 domain-containing protein n=1 Tax=Marinomonas sp. TW1 TaxID=1561203 RepID=UPI0007AFCBA0|nr:DUF2946 domain-containing protein [Marinomonas sp. TW1]KZN13296.1 hypothetical protein OA79_11190 [Marinomonas sp. TW1]
MLTVFTPRLSIHKAKTHVGVFLALFCVFLIYFGPLYSQLAKTLQDSVSTPMAAEHSHSAQQHHGSTHHATDHPLPHSPQPASSNTMGHHGHHTQIEGSTNLLEACGYCSLLFHLSWLDARSFTIVPLDKETYPSIIYATLVRKYLAIFTPLNPRAPPQHSRFTIR